MPAILLVPLIVFVFTLGKATKEHTKVIYVNEASEVQETKVLQPILVIRDENGVSVRSGFERKGSYSRYVRTNNSDMGIFDAADITFYEIKKVNKVEK